MEYLARIESPQMEEVVEALSKEFDTKWVVQSDGTAWADYNKRLSRHDIRQILADVTEAYPGTRIALRSGDGPYLDEQWVVLASEGQTALEYYRVSPPFEGALCSEFTREIFIRADACKCMGN